MSSNDDEKVINKLAVIMHPDNTVVEVPLTKKPTLEQLQGWVDGYIELAPCRYRNRKRSMYINEEGKMKDMPKNSNATNAFWAHYEHEGIPTNDYIVGPAVILIGYE